MKATGRPGRRKAPRKSSASRKVKTPAQAEERRLVEAAQSDPARFDALYEQHFERVYAFVNGRVHDRATAEDLTSEVFYKALANLNVGFAAAAGEAVPPRRCAVVGHRSRASPPAA